MAPCKKAEWLHNLTFVCGLLYAKAWIKYLLKLVSFISENAHGRISSKPGSFFNSSGSSSDSEANQRAAQCGPYQAPSWPCTFHISPSLLGRHPSWFLLSAKKKEPANEREGLERRMEGRYSPDKAAENQRRGSQRAWPRRAGRRNFIFI